MPVVAVDTVNFPDEILCESLRDSGIEKSKICRIGGKGTVSGVIDIDKIFAFFFVIRLETRMIHNIVGNAAARILPGDPVDRRLGGASFEFKRHCCRCLRSGQFVEEPV